MELVVCMVRRISIQIWMRDQLKMIHVQITCYKIRGYTMSIKAVSVRNAARGSAAHDFTLPEYHNT